MSAAIARTSTEMAADTCRHRGTGLDLALEQASCVLVAPWIQLAQQVHVGVAEDGAT